MLDVMLDVADPRINVRPTHVRTAQLDALVLGNAVSLGGNVVMTVAIPWLVLTTTGSAALTGIAVFAGAGGAALGGMLAGRIVDAIGAVRASWAADLLSGLAVAPLPILLTFDALAIWQVVLLTALGTLVDSTGSTARQSLVPELAELGGYQRERANALFTSAEHVGYLLGAPVAGVLIAAVGVDGALWVAASTFAFSALIVRCRVRVPTVASVASSEDSASLPEVMSFIWSDPALRALVVFPTLAVTIVGPLVPLVLPVLARQSFDDPVVLGAMVASFGAGGLIGTAGYGMAGARIPRGALYRGVFIVWPLAFAVITLSQSLPISLISLLVLGAAAGALVPLQATIRQERSPARLLARVVGLSTASIPVAAPIGVLVTGGLIDTLHLHRTMLLMTAVAAVIGATVFISRTPNAFDTKAEAPATLRPSRRVGCHPSSRS